MIKIADETEQKNEPGYRSDAERMRLKRAAERDIIIPAIEDRDRRIQLEQDDEAWLQFYFPHVFKHAFTPDQSQSVTEVDRAVRYGTKKCIAGPRGDGKTSITRFKTLKSLVEKRPDRRPVCPFALYIAASDPKAKESEQTIKYELRTGCSEHGRTFIPRTPFGRDYPFECAIASYVARAPSRANNVTTHGGWKIHVQWADGLILPSLEIGDVDGQETWDMWMIKPGVLGGMLMLCGIFSSTLQGSNVLNMRPRSVILDDLDKRESLATKSDRLAVADGGKAAPKIRELLSKTISGMKGQGEPMGQVMLCTVTTRNSVAFRYSDPEQEPSWSGVRKKRVYKWPVREDLWDKYIELRQKGKREKDEDGNTVDPTGRVAHQFYLDNKDEMDRGAVLGNYNVHDETIQEDGTKAQESTLQACYDFIADEGEESFKTEYQQEPLEEEDDGSLVLTAYHVQNKARSGLPAKVVPVGTAGIVCGVDIKKLGLHYVVMAYSESPTKSAIIEYNFHETKFAGSYLKAEDAERAILNALHEWREERDENPYLDDEGNEYLIKLACIDRGYKEESWVSQPVDQFCGEVGWDRFFPAVGRGDGQYRSSSHRTIIGDNHHVSFPKSNPVPFVIWNSDHWKLKVQESLLIKPGDPGSLTLHEPSATKKGRRQQPHLSIAKHITSEVWKEQFVPGFRGNVLKFWKEGSQNHYLDACAQALVARAMLGVNTLSDGGPPVPAPATSGPLQPPGIDYVQEYVQERSW